MNPATTYCVEEIDATGKHVATVSGMGRNRGTWDSSARSLRTARRWAAESRRDNPGKRYRVATSH